MALTILPMTEADLPAFLAIETAAFRDHPRTPMLWPKGYTAAVHAYFMDRKVSSFRDPVGRFMYAADASTGTMLAGSEWTFALDADANAAHPIADEHEQPPPKWPVEGNWRMSLFFKREWQMYLQRTFPGKPYIVLEILTVDPNVQRRGAGTALLSWGVNQADQLGVPICLESTPAGLTLYKRFGFTEVRVLRADMKDFGFNEPYDEDAAIRVWMIRQPHAKRAEGVVTS